MEKGNKKSKGNSSLMYIKKNWQLYVVFMMPVLLLTLVFKYLPIGGLLMAFKAYNPRLGILGSDWVGMKNFTRFISSPDFVGYLLNTLKLSIYGLLWGFPVPAILALLLNRINSKRIKRISSLFCMHPTGRFGSLAQCKTGIKQYAEQKKAEWILNGGVEKEWDNYLKKLYQLNLKKYLEIKQKYLDAYLAK
jgi:hypothetical protein